MSTFSNMKQLATFLNNVTPPPAPSAPTGRTFATTAKPPAPAPPPVTIAKRSAIAPGAQMLLKVAADSVSQPAPAVHYSRSHRDAAASAGDTQAMADRAADAVTSRAPAPSENTDDLATLLTSHGPVTVSKGEVREFYTRFYLDVGSRLGLAS